MAQDWHGTMLRDVQALFDVGTIGGLTDGQLLERFATRGGEAAELAFAALVERHGPMVLRVCRSSCATRTTPTTPSRPRSWSWSPGPLALGARLAGPLAPSGGTSRRAIRARSAVGPAPQHERRAAESASRRRRAENATGEDRGRSSTRRSGGLPEHLPRGDRALRPGGLTQEQAARRLGWPIGTVQSRLSRGPRRLRARLTRRGLAPLGRTPRARRRRRAGGRGAGRPDGGAARAAGVIAAGGGFDGRGGLGLGRRGIMEGVSEEPCPRFSSGGSVHGRAGGGGLAAAGAACLARQPGGGPGGPAAGTGDDVRCRPTSSSRPTCSSSRCRRRCRAADLRRAAGPARRQDLAGLLRRGLRRRPDHRGDQGEGHPPPPQVPARRRSSAWSSPEPGKPGKSTGGRPRRTPAGSMST